MIEVNKPSDWLKVLDFTAFYPEYTLEELRPYGISYAGGVLTSHITWDRPYITFGRTVGIAVMTERELYARAEALGLAINITRHTEDRQVFAWEVVEAVWRLVRPITVMHPPSEYEARTDVKARLDLSALVDMGY